MAKRDVEKRVAELRELRKSPATPETAQTLRKALEDRSNLVVAEAAKTAGALRLQSLAPDLNAAFHGLIDDGAKRDPRCRGKKAIIEALTLMESLDSTITLQGLRYIQMEPVYGGQEDTAVALRATCTLALVHCMDLRRAEILRHVVDALTDTEDAVRSDAARALEQVGGDDSALMLRLKARAGDEKPRVVGQALESLLTIEGEHAVSFVSEFLESRDVEIFEEAALVLGASRLPQALARLKSVWERERNRPRGDALLRLIAASRRPDGIEFLLSLIREGSDRDASTAAKALEVHRDSPELQDRLRDALKVRKMGS